MSRSRKHTLCPRALRARTSARNVVACPLPHEEVMERPKITMSKGLVMYPKNSNLSHYGIPHFNNHFVVKQSLQLQRAMLISVLSEDPPPRRFTNLLCSVTVQSH